MEINQVQASTFKIQYTIYIYSRVPFWNGSVARKYN